MQPNKYRIVYRFDDDDLNLNQEWGDVAIVEAFSVELACNRLYRETENYGQIEIYEIETWYEWKEEVTYPIEQHSIYAHKLFEELQKIRAQDTVDDDDFGLRVATDLRVIIEEHDRYF